MLNVGVCCRPDDSRDVAAHLRDRLADGLGTAAVVRDITTLEESSGCDPVVVIIGKGWLESADVEGRRRLDDPSDTIRVQVATALAAGAVVIPVLLGGADAQA